MEGETTMTREEFAKLEEKLREAGYRKYDGAITTNDYYFCKGFVYYEDEYGEEHPSYQIIYAVWDYDKYPQVPDSDKVGVQVRIMLNDNDRIDLIMQKDSYDIKNIEAKAERFFAFGQVYLIEKGAKK